ncbi:ribonuclease H-like domain-containing protein, partial [Tanacetum coccineum]
AQFPAASTVVAQTPQMQYRSANVPFYGAPTMYPTPVSYATILLQAFHTMTPRDPSWNMNTGASSHLPDNAVRQFTRDNDVSVELDAYDFLVKDYQTGRLLLRCDSTGDLYPVTQQPSSQTPVVLLSFSSTTWYRFMGHPGDDVLRRLESRDLISCRKSKLSALCHACQLEPRFTPCIFLGYPTNHRGYRCLDLASNKIIISRHVRFDEDVFPFGNVTSSNKPTYDFLLSPIQTTTNVPTTEPFVQHMDEPNNPITPHLTTPPSSPPQPDTPPSHSSTPIPPQTNTHPSHNSTPILTSTQTQSHAQTVDSHTPIPINNSSQTMSTHPMVTRAKASIFKPLERMNYHVTTTSPLPRSHVHTLRDPNRKETMLDEYNALITNGTWVLVPRPTNVNVVRSMWFFKHKFNADGSLSRYKARLVANGRSQQLGIDCDETFSPVVKLATICTVLSLAVSRDWPIHQLDVKNAFLHGHLSETVYMHQPPGFVDLNKPDYVCHLHRSLYGLNQASRTCISTLDHCFPPSEFAMKDLGSLNYFLGISAQRSTSGLFLSQSKFAKKILERAYMQHCNPCRTPMDTESMLGSNGDPISDPTLYRSLAVAFGLQLHASSTAQLTAYTDADWAGCPVTRRSTSGYCVFLGDNLLSWSAKRQVNFSRSSAEAEYLGVANVVAETAWLQNFLLELHAPLTTATLVYCDNVSVVYLPTNPVQHHL